MTFDGPILTLRFLTLMAILSNQPTIIVDASRPVQGDEDYNDYDGHGGRGHSTRAYGNPPHLHWSYYQYQPWGLHSHGHHSDRGYDPSPPRPQHAHHGDQGKSLTPHLNHRHGAHGGSDALENTRTINVGHSGTNPQSVGGQGGKRMHSGNRGKHPSPHRTGTKPKPTRPVVKNTTQSTDFVFPDRLTFTPRNTSCAKGSTFCEEAGAEYPKEYIREILRQEGSRFKEVFGEDLILETNITERFYPDESNLCPSSNRLIYPTQAKNANDQWQFVINQDSYKQGILVETCISPDEPCSMAYGFPQSYRTTCKQKYITRRLLSLKENGSAAMNEFLFPSCCVCMVYQVGVGTRTKIRTNAND